MWCCYEPAHDLAASAEKDNMLKVKLKPTVAALSYLSGSMSHPTCVSSFLAADEGIPPRPASLLQATATATGR